MTNINPGDTRTVVVPDHGEYELPASLSVEEIRATLSATLGITGLENAVASTSPEGTLTFARPTGGTKGAR